MKAAAALRTAWPAGVEIALDGDDLVLDASSPPPEPVLDARRPEAELRAAFDAARPRILGVLIDAVVQGLRMLPDTKLKRLPRMADFALWASACEAAIWSAYCGNRDEAIENVIEADPVGQLSPRAMDETQATTLAPWDRRGPGGRGRAVIEADREAR